MILQSVSASFDFSQPLFVHCPCGNFSNTNTSWVRSSAAGRRRKQVLIAGFRRKDVRRKLGFTACAISPDGSGTNNMNIEIANSTRRAAKNLVLKRFSSELDALDEFSNESQIQMGSNFTSFQEDPFVDKLRTQLGVIHPMPSPPINRNIVGLFVFFFFVGVGFDKFWTSRKKGKRGSENGPREAWPQVPTSFSLFLEKDLQRKESVEWVNMVLGKLWKVYRAGLENWLIGLLQSVIDNLKKPDYVERVEIKQFSQGDEPLSVRNVERRTSRRVNDLQTQEIHFSIDLLQPYTLHPHYKKSHCQVSAFTSIFYKTRLPKGSDIDDHN